MTVPGPEESAPLDEVLAIVHELEREGVVSRVVAREPAPGMLDIRPRMDGGADETGAARGGLSRRGGR